MKTKKVETTSFYEVYVAADGREFNDREACVQYEKTFKCAIRSMIAELAISKTTEYCMFEAGCDDNKAYALIPRNSEDILRLKQFMSACDSNPDQVTDDMIGKKVIVTCGYDEDWAEVRTLDSIIERIEKWFVTK